MEEQQKEPQPVPWTALRKLSFPWNTQRKEKKLPPNPAPKPKGGWRAIYTELVFTVAYLYNYLASRKWLLG